MNVDPETARFRFEHQSKAYYFCSQHCLDRFRAEPGKYLAPKPAALVTLMPSAHGARASRPPAGGPEGRAPSRSYTCPMHPGVVRDQPGACPICGMALEPQTVAAEEEANPELTDMKRRFRLSVALSAPLLLLAMSDMLPGIGHAAPACLLTWIELALATPVVLWGGWVFFQRGWASLVNRSLNMFTLIALGTGAAYAYSVAATIAPGIFPASFRGHGGAVPVYFEAAAIITTLVLLGQVLELRARSRDLERHPGAARARAQNRAHRPPRRRRGGHRARPRSSRRPPARKAGGKSAGRWRAGRRKQLGR